MSQSMRASAISARPIRCTGIGLSVERVLCVLSPAVGGGDDDAVGEWLLARGGEE